MVNSVLILSWILCDTPKISRGKNLIIVPLSRQHNRDIEKRVSYFLHCELCLKALKSSQESSLRTTERIVALKIAANYRALWNIARKIGPFQTIGTAKMHWTITSCRGNIAWSEISLKSSEMPGILTKFVCITFAQYCKCHKTTAILCIQILLFRQSQDHIPKHVPYKVPNLTFLTEIAWTAHRSGSKVIHKAGSWDCHEL